MFGDTYVSYSNFSVIAPMRLQVEVAMGVATVGVVVGVVVEVAIVLATIAVKLATSQGKIKQMMCIDIGIYLEI